MNNSYKIFITEAKEVTSEFPALQLCIREDSLPYLVGKFKLYSNEGILYDNYSIRIECSSNYPYSFPNVFETANRLPYNIDWHVYNDGHFCICTPFEEHIYCAKGFTLLEFINEQILPYLHNQSYREREGYFLNERSHGDKGLHESIIQILNVKSISEAKALLHYIYQNNHPSRTAMCFCGSKRKYRYCHRESFIKIKRIGQEKIKLYIEFL